MIENKRIHAYFSGSVQGVGFRFTAERLASALGLTGWVKNLQDGRVEVTCEGQEKDINGFLLRRVCKRTFAQHGANKAFRSNERVL